MPVDPVEDALRHFTGLLRLLDEEWRERPDYPGFDDPGAKLAEPDDAPPPERPFRENYELHDVTPGIDYAHRWDSYRHDAPDYPFAHVQSRSDVPPPALWRAPEAPQAAGRVDLAASGAGRAAAANADLEVPPPGGHALGVKQKNMLTDRDLLVGENDPLAREAFAVQVRESEAAVDAMLARVEAVAAALPTLAGGPSQLDASALNDRLDDWAAVAPVHATDEGGSLAIMRVDAGLHVDGAPALQAPRPNVDRPEPEDNSSFVQTGANHLVNEFTAVDAMHGASATVVLGSAVSLDAIVQVNAWHTGFLGGAEVAHTETQAHNVAAFSHAASPLAVSGAVVPPPTWVVATHVGDLVHVTWNEQVNLVGDEDMVRFEAGGTETLLVSGENTAVNATSLLSAGVTFDLVIVTGDYAHANMIEQINVLVNRDAVVLGGGAIAAGGDTLLNVAEIRSVGETRLETANPDLANAAAAFARDRADEADLDALEAVVARSSEALRVLVVEGDMIDLTLVRQTNVLGDDDAVSMLAQGLEASGAAGIHIDLHAGGNLLLNAATVVEAGPDATVHVAGTAYSDALLVQAELIGPDGGASGTSTGALMAADPAALASEAVAFLQDTPGLSDGEDAALAIAPTMQTDHAPADVMAAMVA